MAKRFLMTQLWRIQQSYAILSLVLWGIVITLTAFPIVFPFFQRNLGFPENAPGAVAATLLLLFVGIFVLLFGFGIVYDRYLRLWREQLDVTYDRNPYTREKLMVKEILLWRHMFLPALRATAVSDPTARTEIDFMERWIERTLVEDANIRSGVEQAQRWIESGGSATRE
ncbi:MAG: hypothetical protein E6K10_08595 [Methanobacteriota archaeon]|nr:MAG: hypothetical protein E6K10_08595 [Euryarchaeota archaeon]HYS71860.1 hypothetical protein [Thermoplasmata archaeon]